MPEITPLQIVTEIDNYVNDFSENIGDLQAKLYRKISGILKELSLDSEGNIKRTASNIKIINDVQKELNKAINNTEFHVQIANLESALDDVNYLQTKYFKQIESSASLPPAISELQEQSFNKVIDELTGAGMKDNLVNEGVKVLRQSILEGSSFQVMTDAMKKFMVGNDEVEGKMVSYAKQIVSDTMHTNARVYNSIMTDQLGLEWYQYIGALVEASRPWCDAMVAKEWVHVSEFTAVCKGEINGVKVKLTGLMPDTNRENVIERCGGYNCRHGMFPVSESVVTLKLRNKIKGVDKTDLKPKRK